MHKHQCVTFLPAMSSHEGDSCMEGSRMGYTTHGRLIRKVAPLQLGTCATSSHVLRLQSIKAGSKITARGTYRGTVGVQEGW